MTNPELHRSSRSPPRVPSNRLATNTATVIDAGAELTKTVSELMKDVAKTMQDVPFVEGIAGIILRIIQIRDASFDEMKTKKDRCKELVDKVLRRTLVVFEALQQLADSPSGNPSLVSLKGRLEAYNNILVQIHGRLAAFAAKGTVSKLWDRDTGSFKECNRLIDDFKDDILLKIATDLITQHAVPSPSHMPRQFKSWIPSPSTMFGRNVELDKIRHALLHSNLPRLAILGPGGMGKTTLALTSMHEPDIQEKYTCCLFVSCEACTTVGAVLVEFADALEIPAENRDAKLHKTIMGRLSKSGPVILCLDNFETPWFDSSSRRSIEEFLRSLDSIPDLALLLTMRGTERPTGLRWTLPLFPPLEPLSSSSMMDILDAAASHQANLADEDLGRLMVDIDGLPLAATLLGHLLQGGNETPKSLWRRWSKDNVKALETDETDRLYSLHRSISISLSSSVMRKCPGARIVLSLLASLPDGFSSSDHLIDGLNRHFAEDVDLHHDISVLRKVALVYIDPASQRIRILPPIRRFCLSELPLSQMARHSITKFYLELLDEHSDDELAENHRIIPPEMHNLETTIFQALNHAPDEPVFDAVEMFIWWSIRLGIYSPALAIYARNRSQTPGTQANLWYLEGWLAYHRDDYIQGEAEFKAAVEMFRELGDYENEARALGQLGDLYLLQGRLEDAAPVLRDALSLNPPMWRKEHILECLADIDRHRRQHDQAAKSLQDALQLHGQAQNEVGEVKTLESLGDLYVRRGQLDEAEIFLQDALRLHQQVQNDAGQANTLQALGDLYLRRERLDEAEKFLQDALRLCQQVQYRLGEANALQTLVDLCIRRDQLVKADKLLDRALKFQREEQNWPAAANILERLGDLCLRRGQPNEAEKFLKEALQLHRRVHDSGNAVESRSLAPSG